MGKQDLYIKVLEEELEPALGCTEPIAHRLHRRRGAAGAGHVSGTHHRLLQWKYHQECQKRHCPQHGRRAGRRGQLSGGRHRQCATV